MRAPLFILTFGSLHLCATACESGGAEREAAENSPNSTGGSGAEGSGASDPGGGAGRASSSGGAAAGGSGGAAGGGAGTGGTGGDAGTGGSDGTGGDGTGGDDGTGGGGGSTVEPSEFVRCFPWAFSDPQEGPLLAATPTNTMILVGPSAPADVIPNALDTPFLVEFSVSGQVLRGITFPEAAGPQVVTVSEDGFIFAAGQDRTDTRFGEFELPNHEEGGYYLVKISPELKILAARMVEAPATQVNALHVDDGGDLIVGTAVADFAEGSMHPVVTKVSGDTLEEEWSTVSEHEIMPALVSSLATLPDGRIVAAGHYSRELTIGPFVLSKPVDVLDDPYVYNGWVAWLSASDGAPVAAESWGGLINNGILDMAVTSSGHVRLLGAPSSGNLSVFDTELNAGPAEIGVLVDLDSAALTQRVVPLQKDDETVISRMALGATGETYLAGGYGSPTADANSRGSEIRRIDPDETPGPTLRLSTGNHIKQLAIDTSGGIWISAGWETPFEWNGETHVPPLQGSGDGERCRMVLRTNGL